MAQDGPRPETPPSPDGVEADVDPTTADPGPPAPPPDRTRTFPCTACGADLQFDPGVQSLRCPFCGSVEALEAEPDALHERDYDEAIRRLAELRDGDGAARREAASVREIDCAACGATARFAGSLESDACAYCGAPIQADDAHAATDRIPVDGVLPFRVERRGARDRMRAWVRSRWFAPDEFTRRGVEGRFEGVYLPYWTFDAQTHNAYVGQRGDHYWVTTGSGKNRRRVRRTRWRPASGSFRKLFDDVLVIATTGVPVDRLAALEPWPLDACVPYAPELLAGFQSRTYDIDLEPGYGAARRAMDGAIRAEVRARIGGDEQRILKLDTACEGVTYKHLLLPVWLLAYRYRQKTYRVLVNAVTGEVQGDRPWSWVKIGLAAAAVAAAVVVVVLVRSLAG